MGCGDTTMLPGHTPPADPQRGRCGVLAMVARWRPFGAVGSVGAFKRLTRPSPSSAQRDTQPSQRHDFRTYRPWSSVNTIQLTGVEQATHALGFADVSPQYLVKGCFTVCSNWVELGRTGKKITVRPLRSEQIRSQKTRHGLPCSRQVEHRVRRARNQHHAGLLVVFQRRAAMALRLRVAQPGVGG